MITRLLPLFTLLLASCQVDEAARAVAGEVLEAWGEGESIDLGAAGLPPTGRLTVLVGRRYLDDPFFEPGEEHTHIGFEISQIPTDNLFGAEAGLALSSQDRGNTTSPGLGTGDLELDQTEVWVGARMELEFGWFVPYGAFGVTHITMERAVRNGTVKTSEADGTWGGFLQGGALVRVTDSAFIGLEYRRVIAEDFEFVGQDVNSDYDQISFVLSWAI